MSETTSKPTQTSTKPRNPSSNSNSNVVASSSKPPQSPKPDGAKGRSAKELKKEKRAAAVSARGPDSAPDAQPAADVAANPPAPPSKAGPSKLTKIELNQPKRIQLEAPPISLQFTSHLPLSAAALSSESRLNPRLHPAVVRVGNLMSSGTLRGTNARIMGMMVAFREAIRDYETPERAVMWKDLTGWLSPMIAWLEERRPKGVGGGNAIRQVACESRES